MGAKVINLSLSTSTPSMALTMAIGFAVAQGRIVVAAYGNKGLLNPTVFPADLPNVISVAATDANDVRAVFSNWGPPADVGAPGVQMVGPYGPGGYAIASGTSFACPLVAGQAALLLSKGERPGTERPAGSAQRRDDGPAHRHVRRHLRPEPRRPGLPARRRPLARSKALGAQAAAFRSAEHSRLSRGSIRSPRHPEHTRIDAPAAHAAGASPCCARSRRSASHQYHNAVGALMCVLLFRYDRRTGRRTSGFRSVGTWRG